MDGFDIETMTYILPHSLVEDHTLDGYDKNADLGTPLRIDDLDPSRLMV